jgi:hypothetical protein
LDDWLKEKQRKDKQFISVIVAGIANSQSYEPGNIMVRGTFHGECVSE